MKRLEGRVAVVTGVLFGIFPALQTSRPDLHEELKGGANQALLIAAAHGHPAGLIAGLIGKIFQDFRYGRNTAQLARIFTQGNVSDLQALASAPANSLRASAALAGLVARDNQPEPPEAAVSHLQQNPHLAPDFQSKYGVDPSRYLPPQ